MKIRRFSANRTNLEKTNDGRQRNSKLQKHSHFILRLDSAMVLLSLSRSALRQTASSLTKKSSVNVTRSMSTASPWAHFEMAPLDPIIGLNESFAADDFPQKVIVGVGAYRDDSGKPYVLPCVREAEKIMMSKNLDMEYAGIVSNCKIAQERESLTASNSLILFLRNFFLGW